MEFNNPVISPVPVLQWGRTLDSLSMWWCLIMASYFKCVFFYLFVMQTGFRFLRPSKHDKLKRKKEKDRTRFLCSWTNKFIMSSSSFCVTRGQGGEALWKKGHTAEVVPAQVKLAAVTLWGKGCVYFPHPQGSTGIQPGLRIRFTCTNGTLGGRGDEPEPELRR